MEKPLRCPNCGRNLTENELYCYFCEFEIKKFSDKSSKFFSKVKHKKKSLKI